MFSKQKMNIPKLSKVKIDTFVVPGVWSISKNKEKKLKAETEARLIPLDELEIRLVITQLISLIKSLETNKEKL